jgi:hypothetical protein
MEKENTKNRSREVLAIVLIALGIFWLLGQLNVQFHLENLFRPFYQVFSHIGRVIFSWPLIFVLVGLVLIAGKRQVGWILIVLGGIFLIPKIFLIPDFSFSFIFPVILLFAGIAMLVKRI